MIAKTFFIKSHVQGTRKVCLIIDEQERDNKRLLDLMASKGVDAQVRQLSSGDYIWILTPPMYDPQRSYTGKQPQDELVDIHVMLINNKIVYIFEHGVSNVW